MISIITCSRSKLDLQVLERNIQETIGLPYELIVIENPEGAFGLCHAYNIGKSQARYPYLCFMHDDIRYESFNWGQRLVDSLNDPETGLIGLSGGIAKTEVPTDSSGLFRERESNFIQHHKHILAEDTYMHFSYSKINRAPVVVLDGMWLAARKDVADTYDFDEDTFKGFHGYDIDYSLQVLHSHKLFVVHDIVAHHLSEGQYTKEWVDSALKLCKKWEAVLPVYIDNFPISAFNELLFKDIKFFCRILARLDFSLIFLVAACAKYSLKLHFKPTVFVRSLLYAFKYKLFSSS